MNVAKLESSTVPSSIKIIHHSPPSSPIEILSEVASLTGEMSRPMVGHPENKHKKQRFTRVNPSDKMEHTSSDSSFSSDKNEFDTNSVKSGKTSLAIISTGDDSDKEQGFDSLDHGHKEGGQSQASLKTSSSEPKTTRKKRRRQLLTEEERRHKRVLANRKSARTSRERRKKLLTDMQSMVQKLLHDNKALQKANDELRDELKDLNHCAQLLAAGSNSSAATSSNVGGRASRSLQPPLGTHDLFLPTAARAHFSHLPSAPSSLLQQEVALAGIPPGLGNFVWESQRPTDIMASVRARDEELLRILASRSASNAAAAAPGLTGLTTIPSMPALAAAAAARNNTSSSSSSGRNSPKASSVPMPKDDVDSLLLAGRSPFAARQIHHNGLSPSEAQLAILREHALATTAGETAATIGLPGHHPGQN